MKEKLKTICMTFLEKAKKYKQKIQSYFVEEIKPKLSYKTITLSVIVLILMLGTIGFGIGRVVSSKSYVLAQIEKGFKDKNYKLIIKNSKITGIKLNKDNIEPLMKYYKNNNTIDYLIKDLKNKSKSGEVISFKVKKGLLFNTYYLEISPVYLSMKVNYGDTKLLLNSKDIGTVNEDNEEKSYGPMVPGIYKLEAINKNKFDTISFNDEMSIMKTKEEKSIELNGIRISINCEFPNAKVFINGKDTNLRVSEFNKIGPFKNDGSSSLHIEEDLPWGTVKSQDTSIERSSEIHINLDLKNQKLNEDINTKVNEFFTSVFNALNNEDENIINSNNKKKIYEEFQQEEFLLRNDYKLLNYNLEIEKSDFKKENDKFLGNIYLNMKYKVSKSLFGIDLPGKEIETKFFLQVQYEDNQWKVENMQILK